MANRTANYTAFYVKEPFSESNLGANATPDFLYYNQLSDGTLWEGQIALYFRWTCLPDCAVLELDADYRRNNRRLS